MKYKDIICYIIKNNNMSLCECCCENINKKCLFTCNNCLYVCCKKCYNKYFLIIDESPKCMNCNITINAYNLFKMVSIKWFFGRYVKNKTNLLIKKQQILLESTKADADLKKKENLIRNKYKSLYNQRKLINKQLKELKTQFKNINKGVYNSDDDWSDVNISDVNMSDVDGSDVNMSDVDGSDVNISDVDGSDVNNKVVIYNRPKIKVNIELLEPYKSSNKPSMDDEVESYNASYKCKTNLYVEGDLIKNCPLCGEFITKSEGCDIVKCNCGTKFNWKTGEVIDKMIPIFNELKEPKLQFDTTSFTDDEFIKIKGIYNNVVEFIRYKMKHFLNILSSNKVSGEDKYRQFRIDFLINKINQKTFIKKIKKISKIENYKLYIIQLILLAYEKAVNIFNTNVNKLSLELLEEIIENINITIINITKYLKYSNNIRLYQWFNLNDEKKLLY